MRWSMNILISLAKESHTIALTVSLLLPLSHSLPLALSPSLDLSRSCWLVLSLPLSLSRLLSLSLSLALFLPIHASIRLLTCVHTYPILSGVGQVLVNLQGRKNVFTG